MRINKICSIILCLSICSMMCLMPSFNSLAATLSPSGQYDCAGMNSNGELVGSVDAFSSNTTDMWGLASGASATYDSVTLDRSNRTITFNNFVSSNSELYIGEGSDGYNYRFNGSSTFEGFASDYASIEISVNPGSNVNLSVWYGFTNSLISLANGTSSSYDVSSISSTDQYNGSIILTASGIDSSTSGNSSELNPSGESPILPSDESPEESAAKKFNEGIKKECDEIRVIAATGMKPDGTPVAGGFINYDVGNALSGEIIKTMASVQGVTLLYTFEYQGIIFLSAITPDGAAAVVGENVPWCGPCYLAEKFPTVPIGVAPAA